MFFVYSVHVSLCVCVCVLDAGQTNVCVVTQVFQKACDLSVCFTFVIGECFIFSGPVLSICLGGRGVGSPDQSQHSFQTYLFLY